METLVATAALGSVSMVRRASNPVSFSNRYARGNVKSISCRRGPPQVARIVETRARVDSSNHQDDSSSNLLSVGRLAALFLGSSALFLAAGLNSCRTACAHEEPSGATVTVERTVTSEEEGGSSAEVIEENKKEVEILEWLSKAHEQMEKRNMPGAIKLLDKLIEINPSQLEFRFIRGHAYEYMGDLDSALKEFEDVVKIHPLSVRGLQGLALVLNKQGKNIDFIQKTVEEAAAKAAEENNTAESVTYRMLLAQILTLKNELPLALEHYEQLCREDPSDFRPHLCQGLVCCILGDVERAEEHFKNFEKHCPEAHKGRDAMEELIANARVEAKNKAP